MKIAKWYLEVHGCNCGMAKISSVVTLVTNSIPKPPALPVRIEKVLPLQRDMYRYTSYVAAGGLGMGIKKNFYLVFIML